jgi:hypothetical protein
MNFRDEKPEIILPLFTGTLGALFLCTLFAVQTSFFKKPPEQTPVIEIKISNRQEENGVHFLLVETEKKTDAILELYRDSEYRMWVIDFFSEVCLSREVAQVILDSSDEFDVPPSLAFSLSWEESNFNRRAVNRRNQNGSIDRGLFQLNNQSFPQLEIHDFFNISKNARYGISHLRYCLNTGGNEIAALAMYNAGTGRVRGSGAPKVTLDYVNRILKNQKKIENLFHNTFIKEEEARLSEEKTENTVKPQFGRILSSASPL